MIKGDGFLVRKARAGDIQSLSQFFIKAYGQRTVFQNPGFLQYYFKSYNESIDILEGNLIATTTDGEIVSHYGGLNYELKLNDKLVSGYWGVNAYTLPEWRGKGINSMMVKWLAINNGFNAVIGMPFEAPFFYKKYGYNSFGKKTLSRYIQVLRDEAFNLTRFLGNEVDRARNLLIVNSKISGGQPTPGVIEINSNNYNNFEFQLTSPVKVTTDRSRNFLDWRVFKNPYIKYSVFGIPIRQKIVSYVVVREELLLPHNFSVARIIDLFGETEYIEPLLNRVTCLAKERNNVYVDFSAFGTVYKKILLEHGFNLLEGEDCCLLPQVSAPIENRPNHEFIVLQSTENEARIQSLSEEDVYFTRIDGDRDRIAQITQIKKEQT